MSVLPEPLLAAVVSSCRGLLQPLPAAAPCLRRRSAAATATAAAAGYTSLLTPLLALRLPINPPLKPIPPLPGPLVLSFLSALLSHAGASQALPASGSLPGVVQQAPAADAG